MRRGDSTLHHGERECAWSDTTWAGSAGARKFQGDSSFGYKALRDFRAALPRALEAVPADASAAEFRSALRALVTAHRDASSTRRRGTLSSAYSRYPAAPATGSRGAAARRPLPSWPAAPG